MKIEIVNKSQNELPKYETLLASGMDVRASFTKVEEIGVAEGAAHIDDKVEGGVLVIQPFSRVMIPTGLYVAIEEGYEIQVRARSGKSYKEGLIVAQGVGTIDADYRGECKVCLTNISPNVQYVENGERIAQFVVAASIQAELVQVETLSGTARGTGGFGSTGK